MMELSSWEKAPTLFEWDFGEHQTLYKLFGEEKIFAHSGIRAPDRPVHSIWDSLQSLPAHSGVVLNPLAPEFSFKF
jgi:hypothetical protein